MDFYWGGAEINALADTLMGEGLSKFAVGWPVRGTGIDHLPLDSGVILMPESKQFDTVEELSGVVKDYYGFAERNSDRLDLVLEYPLLGVLPDDVTAWRATLRERFSRFVPIWFPSEGMEPLEKLLAETYYRVGVLMPDNPVDLGEMIDLLSSYGTSVHVLNTLKPEHLGRHLWDSASSNGWTYPVRYGETFLWTRSGSMIDPYSRWHWFAADKEERLKPKYKPDVEALGLDWDKVQAHDPEAVNRLAIRSISKMLEAVHQHQHGPTPTESAVLATPRPEPRTSSLRTADGELLVHTRPNTTPIEHFPVMVEWVENSEETEVRHLGASSESIRVCNSCFLSTKCPRYQPDKSCAFKIPVMIQTDDDLVALSNALIEIQTQRVVFARFAEEIDGGPPDPAVSKEMDRLSKMVKQRRDLTKESASLTITASASGGGVLSRLFGGAPGADIPPARVIEQ